jgi:multidrug efflux pump subunit AcrB
VDGIIGARLFSAADYRSLPVAWRNAAPVRLMDLATVTVSLDNGKEIAWLGDHPAVIILSDQV